MGSIAALLVLAMEVVLTASRHKCPVVTWQDLLSFFAEILIKKLLFFPIFLISHKEEGNRIDYQCEYLIIKFCKANVNGDSLGYVSNSRYVWLQYIIQDKLESNFYLKYFYIINIMDKFTRLIHIKENYTTEWVSLAYDNVFFHSRTVFNDQLFILLLMA